MYLKQMHRSFAPTPVRATAARARRTPEAQDHDLDHCDQLAGRNTVAAALR